MQGSWSCGTDFHLYPNGERTKINYKDRIAQYIDLVNNKCLYIV